MVYGSRGRRGSRTPRFVRRAFEIPVFTMEQRRILLHRQDHDVRVGKRLPIAGTKSDGLSVHDGWHGACLGPPRRRRKPNGQSRKAGRKTFFDVLTPPRAKRDLAFTGVVHEARRRSPSPREHRARFAGNGGRATDPTMEERHEVPGRGRRKSDSIQGRGGKAAGELPERASASDAWARVRHGNVQDDGTGGLQGPRLADGNGRQVWCSRAG